MSRVKITKIYHSCFLIEFQDGLKVLTDPFFGDNLPNSFKLLEIPKIKKEDLPKIDVILVTHEHFDHFNKDLIYYFVKRDNSIVVAPKNVALELNLSKVNLRSVKVDDNLVVMKMNLKVFAAQHPQSFYPISYLIEHENVKIYFAGDTNDLPKVKFNCDIAIMPAGGTYTADLFEFIAMSRRLAPKIAIPMHYNTFLTIKIDIDKLLERAEEKLKQTKVVILNSGESYEF